MSDATLTVMPPKIAGALVKATREAHAVEKGGTVKTASYSYSFAGADALMSEARSALAGAGLAIVLTRWWPTIDRHEETDENGKASAWYARTLFAEFLLVHEDGDTHAIGPYQMPVIEERGRGTDKADAAALTYCTGYVMRGLLNLPRVEKGSQVDERDDSGRTGRREAPPKAPAMSATDKASHAIKDGLNRIGTDGYAPDLATWINDLGAKAVKAIGMEAATALIVAEGERRGATAAAVTAMLDAATAPKK